MRAHPKTQSEASDLDMARGSPRSGESGKLPGLLVDVGAGATERDLQTRDEELHTAGAFSVQPGLAPGMHLGANLGAPGPRKASRNTSDGDEGMLNTALVAAVAGGLLGQTYPDQLDILRGADTTPQMELVLDTSGSMGPSFGLHHTVCSHYFDSLPSNVRSSRTQNFLSRMDILKAVLTGCRSASDGILDRWGSRVNFSISEFGGSRIQLISVPSGGVAEFGTPAANLDAAVLALQEGGGTPLARAYAQAAEHMAGYFNDLNSRACRQSYIVLMTDGDGNYACQSCSFAGGGRATMSIPGLPSVSFDDTDGVFPVGGTGSTGRQFDPPFADLAARTLVRDTNGNLVDALPNVSNFVPGSQVPTLQPIRTYTIDFFAPSNSGELLQAMASAGEGFPYNAQNYDQLNAAFERILSEVVPRSHVAFSPGILQNDGIFSGNYIYVPSFAPAESGFWWGNMKKHCVMPPDPTNTTCFFRYLNGELIVNPSPRDLWSGASGLSTTVGGTGSRIWNQYGISGPNGAVPGSPYNARRILTWRPGVQGYQRFGEHALAPADTWTANRCEHWTLVNKLFGYTYESGVCTGASNGLGVASGAPLGFDAWPLGDTINGGAVLIKYTRECEASTDHCYVATVANDGMLHMVNAYNGQEVAAVIPGDLWAPNNAAIHQLRDLMAQPSTAQHRRYYFDGKLRLFHDDRNNNGYVDGGERAYLIAGLGRGGRSYIQWDLRTFNGNFNNSNNAPRPLTVDEATGFRNLRETWAAPWLGQIRHHGALRDVAVIPSGHQRELDQPLVPFAQLVPGLVAPDPLGAPHSPDCAGFFSHQGITGEIRDFLCGSGVGALPTTCTPCNNVNPLLCSPGIFCYDWPGWAGTGVPILTNHGGPGTGHNVVLGPFEWTAGRNGIAFRVHFSRFDLQPGDYVAILDSAQREVGRLTGSYPGAVSMPWVRDTQFYLRLVSNGIDDAPSSGIAIHRVEVVRGSGTDPSVPVTRPEVYVVDLDFWNGDNGDQGQMYSAPLRGTNARQASAMLVRITSSCSGVTLGPTERCIDAAGGAGLIPLAGPQPDLAHMVCPISGEVSVYTEGGLFRSAYWGDECGQIWKADNSPNAGWSVRRLLRLNNANGSGATMPGLASKDYRKVFTQLELVISTCPGTRAIGVYFGTGNAQRPASFDNLQNPTLTRPSNAVAGTERDVIGVVWDHPGLPTNAGLGQLLNVTQVVEIADTRSGPARNGYYMELLQNESVLRDPLVFDGVAYFKTYRPLDPATECISATSRERVLAFDNCTAAPLVDALGNRPTDVGQRQVWTASTDIGGNLLLFTPRDGPAFVSTGSPVEIGAGLQTPSARLPGRPGRRALKLFLWRTELDPTL